MCNSHTYNDFHFIFQRQFKFPKYRCLCEIAGLYSIEKYTIFLHSKYLIIESRFFTIEETRHYIWSGGGGQFISK